MNDNIYTPPKSDPLANQPESAGQLFYVVSKRKFLGLFFATFGIYQVYWMYKNWSLYKAGTAEEVMPVLRGIFNIFFIHSLFERVQSKLDEKSITVQWNRSDIATGLVVLLVFSNLIGPLGKKLIHSYWLDIFSLATLAPIAFLFLKAQVIINTACGDEQGIGNDRFTIANVVWLVMGTLFWLLVGVGLFLDPESPATI